MAENNATDNSTAAQGQTQQQNQTQQQAQPAFDYEKLADILANRQAANEEAVLKGYFKDKGLSREEADQAISQFRAKKAESTPDVAGLQKQVSDYQKAAIKAQIESKALLMAGEIGVDIKTMPYVIKMADLTGAVTDGKISDEKLKTCLMKVLEDIPQLKVHTDEKQESGFRVGADTGSVGAGASSGNDRLRAAFGLKAKT